MSAPKCDPEAAAEFLRALAHPMRLRILCRLLEGELAVAGLESELGLKQPNLSQQLAALRDAGLVATRRESKSIVYRLADDRVRGILDALRAAQSQRRPVRRAREPALPLASPRRGEAVTPQPPGEASVFAVAGWDTVPSARRG